MGVVWALLEDLVKALHYQELFVIRQIQKAILPDELEDSGRVGDQEGVLGVFFEDKTQALLLGLRIIGVVWARRVSIGRLLNLRLIKEHQVLHLELELVVRWDRDGRRLSLVLGAQMLRLIISCLVSSSSR